MLIAFGINKYVGKDTAAKYLVEKYAYYRLAFGDRPKQATGVIFDFTDKQLNGSETDKETTDPRWGFSPRWATKEVADKVARAICDDVWVIRLKMDMENLKKAHYEKFVISDLRHRHEFDFVKQNGGYCVKIINPRKEHQDTHRSENDLKKHTFDYEIYNDSDIQTFHHRLDNLMLKISLGGKDV